MITLRSALPVRMSYRVNVRSEPILERTEDSERLNFTAEIVSVEVGNVRLEIGALLYIFISIAQGVSTMCVLCLVPDLDNSRGSCEQGIRPVVIY